MLNRVRAKDIRVAVKRDDGMEYLKEHFGFTTNEEVYIAIRQVLPAEADSIISKMSKKHKRVKRRVTSATQENPCVNVLLVKPCNPKFAQMDEILQSMNNPREWEVGRRFDFRMASLATKGDETVKNVVKEESVSEAVMRGAGCMDIILPEGLALHCDVDDGESATAYEELKKNEADLVIALAEQEQKLEASKADTSVKYHELERLKKSVEKLKAEILRTVEEYKVAWHSYSASTEKTASDEAVVKILSEQLSEVRTQLIKLQKISICAYSDGKVEVENAEIPDIPDADINMRFSELASTPAAGNITINELKRVAKLQIMVKTFLESGREVDVLFENTAVQALWENINA